jgi:hypothetical protein
VNTHALPIVLHASLTTVPFSCKREKNPGLSVLRLAKVVKSSERQRVDHREERRSHAHAQEFSTIHEARGLHDVDVPDRVQ